MRKSSLRTFLVILLITVTVAGCQAASASKESMPVQSKGVGIDEEGPAEQFGIVITIEDDYDKYFVYKIEL